MARLTDEQLAAMERIYANRDRAPARFITALVQEVQEARMLPVQERLDLMQVDASRAALEDVLAAVRALPPPASSYQAASRYFKAVAEIIEERLRQWGKTGQEDTP